MRRRRVKNVSAATRLAGERASNNVHMPVKNGSPVRAVAPEAFKSRRRAAGAESELEAAVRDEIEHRRVFRDADRLFERQGHDARAKTNSRRARRDIGEKYKRGGKTAFIAIKVVLGDPGRVEAVPLRVNDLLNRKPIPLSCGRPIEKPSEETEPPSSGDRHAGAEPQSFSWSAGARSGRAPDWSVDEPKNWFSGCGNPRFSRNVLPSYSRRNSPRRCGSGTTLSTKSSRPSGT